VDLYDVPGKISSSGRIRMEPTRGSKKILLDAISDWKLEAESENSNQYFYHLKEVEELENGNKCFVIGRKGTGKTAICQYFEENKTYDKFCMKLSFKEFPFNILYNLEDSSYTTPSQYISIWKYLIYSAILKMMARNESVDSSISKKLQDIYPPDPMEHITKTISTWTKKSNGLAVLGVAGQSSIDRNVNKIEEIWHELIPSMEEVISKYCGSSSYYIVFDELDEDYRNFWNENNRVKYVSLLTSLFKAVSNVRKIFRKYGKSIFPIVFLRDDIYEILSDPDSNKWEDEKVYLRWTKYELKELLRWRISRSLPDTQESYSFDRAMKMVFLSDDYGYGSMQRKRESIFDHISRLTHDRPRDFVRYFRDCARSAISQGATAVSNDTIKGIEKQFSNHLRSELTNEMEGVLPDIRQIFDAFSQLQKDRLSPSDFGSLIRKHQSSKDCSPSTKELEDLTIAKLLFHFSIVGNANRKFKDRPMYKYQHEYLVFNQDEPVVLHRGLLKSLGI
jgi:hypothetical protein